MSAKREKHSDLQSSVLHEVDAFLRELRGSPPRAVIGPETLLEKDLGLGSLERVELLSRLERRFQVEISEQALGQAETPRELAEAFLRGAAPPRLRDTSAIYRPAALPPASKASSLAEVLLERARTEPDATHLFLEENDGPERPWTFSELYSEALTLAGGLSASGARRGDKVAIMLGTGRDFFASFMGTLLIGAVPVPLYPPFNLNRLEDYVAKQAGIVSGSEASVFVTLERGIAVGAVLKADAPALREVVSVSTLVSRSQPFRPDLAGGDEPALIQYTSGSTGNPKGVLLTHANLLANIRAIGQSLDIQSSDVGVSWLPLYHDMGLIGAWLTPLYFGIPVAILSPLAFLARPERWLWTIHTHRGTISPAPNFAYELCARKIRDQDIEGLDLSSWRIALNGAEPVEPATLERFTRRFAAYGLDGASLTPVYGLAESALLVAAPRGRRAPRIVDFDAEALEASGVARPAPRDARVRRLVSVGTSVSGHDVAIVDGEGNELSEGVEGRLLFRGPSSMRGYYRNDEATEAVRRPGGFLDSGDHAFRFDGELFITGRAKDIIIRAGRNLMPHEIEIEAATVNGVRAGCVAAFGVPDRDSGTERIVVVAETRSSDDAERARIRSAIDARVLERVGAPPDDVVLLPPRALLKTSSGKMRRAACRERYLAGELGARSRPSWPWWLRAGRVSAMSFVARFSSRVAGLAYGYYVWLVSALFLGFGWAVAVMVPSRRFLRSFVRSAARAYLAVVGVRLEVRGLDRLANPRPDAAPPFVLAANHASYFDPIPLMAALPIDYAFVVKREAASWPVIGRFIARLGHLPVERLHAAESARATDAMRALLDEGRSIVLFPEGTFSYATGIRPFKLGAFKLAVDSGRPLVPVALVGTRRWLRDGTWIPKRGSLAVFIGEPRIPAEKSFAGAVQLKEETAALISDWAGEPRLDLVAAGPLRRESPRPAAAE